MKQLAATLVFFFASFAAALAQSTPLTDGHMRTGVPSCSTAGCHGDQVTGAGAGPVVGQNEYFKWTSTAQRGAHSRAYEALLTPWGKRIAANLGIGPAHESGECLDCHADNVPASMRSERFQISDGVGCEACHGGAQDWLAFHRIGAGHDQNIAAGMYPTEDPAARAELCLSCHLGSKTKNQFVSHRIMGAGHPRLKFELDLYTAIQQHHTVDADYRARKTAASGAKVWAIGQAAALARTLELIMDDEKGVEGVFPELFFYDCYGCHQPISNDIDDLGWRPNPSRALGPGVPVVNDANFIMLLAAVRVLEPDLAVAFERQGMTLHQASQQGRASLVRAAGALAQTAGQVMTRIEAADFDSPATVKTILREIAGESMAQRYTNYAAAEQALFAVQRLTAAIDAGSPAMTQAINDASRYAQSPYAYNQAGFRRALADIGAMVP